MLKKFWPLVLIFSIWVILFLPFLTKGLLPIPADIITGVYFPWLDYKWGYAVGVPVKNPLISDIPSLLYPWRTTAMRELGQGRLPFWNPYYFAGMPLLANFQSAAFSYVNLFFLFLPQPIAWSLGITLSPLLTMIFLYLFLREQKMSQLSSLLGGIIFALSGFEIAWLEYNVHGHTALFLPLLLLSLDKILKGGKKFWYFLLPVFIAWQIFAGYLPIVIYSYLICLFFVLYFYFWPQLREKKIAWRKYLGLGAGVAFGWLIALPQLLPGLELVKNSIRAIDPLVSASNASYLPLKNFATLLAPDFFGHPATGNYFGQAFYDNFYFFVGTGTLFLVLFSLFFLRRREIVFWWSVLFFSLILVFKNPMGLFLERMFFLSGGVAARALFMTDFALAVLAAWGIEEFLKNEKKGRIFLTLIVMGLLMTMAVWFSFQLANPVHQLVARRNLILPGAVFGFFSLLLAIQIFLPASWRSKSKRFLGILLVLATTAQLLYSARKYLPFSPSRLLFPSTPVIDFLKSEKKKSPEPFRVELGEVIPQNFLMPYGLETISGYDALLPKRIGEFLSFSETGKVGNKISRVQLIRNYQSSVFPLLNVKYVLAKKINEKGIYSPEGHPPGIFKEADFRLVFEDKTVQVYENLNFLPRAFWVYKARIIKDLKTLDEATFANLDLAREVVLEEEVSSLPGKEPTVKKVQWREYRPGRIVLDLESTEPGLVFIANNYYPGWRAKIDGRETKIFRANYTFQAVAVGQGRHQLIMEYSPFLFLEDWRQK
jgi:uncharacterized membrane protein YfhO